MLPAPDDCVLPLVIERWASSAPQRPLAVFEDGATWTYAHAVAEMSDTAHALADLGVTHGEKVVVWLPNGADLLRVWWGANQLGAAFVPINTGYKGALLEHAVNVSEAEVAVVHPQLAERLDAVDTPNLKHVVVLDGPGVLRSGVRTPYRPAQSVQPWDLQSVIYTSGTSGPSKGVLSSFFHLYNTADTVAGLHGLTADDRLMMFFPLFHVGGTIPTCATLLRGGSIAVHEAFNTKGFWPRVRETGSTVCWLTTNMATFLLKEPERADDADNPMRTAAIVANGPTAVKFMQRFGVEGVTMFNQTEANMPIISKIDPANTAFTGRLRDGVEARIVDENDCEVPVGTDGELVLRTEHPWALNSGYIGMPEATARAWRNGWWHTGDRFRRDAEGNYRCVDRINDCIRRRGESISPLEVEAELLAFPEIREAAVVGVPTDDDSNDVLAIVAPKPGATFDPVALIDFLVPRMAHFMVPRYIRVMESLPTTNGRVIRRFLRADGVTDDTWDREAAGIVLKRDRLT